MLRWPLTRSKKVNVDNWLDHLEGYVFWQNSLKQYLFFLMLFFGCWIVLQFCYRFLFGRLRNIAKITKNDVDDYIVNLLGSVRSWFFPLVGAYAGSHFLTLPDSAKKWIGHLFLLLAVIQVVLLISAFLGYFFSKVQLSKNAQNLAASQSSQRNFTMVARIVVWIAAGLFILDNLGLNISSLVAGLGIGGIAVALAAQAILGDAFSAFTIALDKPFEIGDFVIVDEYMGTVEHIGLKTTRVRSLGGELLIFANSDLTKSRIKNYKKMARRRIQFRIGVTYDTSHEKLKSIPELIKLAVTKTTKTNFERCHFLEYGDSALLFDVVYWVESRDYIDYANSQQNINLNIYKSFEENSIEMAFPTQTLHLRNEIRN